MEDSLDINVNLCRFCLDRNGVENIFDGDLDEKILYCANVKAIEGDGLPKLCCTLCMTKLISSYEFKQQVEQCDLQLKHMFSRKHREEHLCHTGESEVNEANLSATCSHKLNIRHKKSNIGTSDDIPKSLDTIANRKYQCHHCGRTFNRTSHLKIHIRSHTGEKPFRCSNCNKSFAASHHLQAHERIHRSEKPFKCSNCAKCISDQSSWSRHTKIHSNHRKFTCQFCEKRFISASDSRKHSIIHTGEKPFKCNVCSKQYADLSNLNKHKKIHLRKQLKNTEMQKNLKMNVNKS